MRNPYQSQAGDQTCYSNNGEFMPIAEVSFSIPDELTKEIQSPSDYAYRSFVLGLYLDEEISFGKAAKLLGMTYDEFLDFLGQKKIPYFRDTPEEINDALKKLSRV